MIRKVILISLLLGSWSHPIVEDTKVDSSESSVESEEVCSFSVHYYNRIFQISTNPINLTNMM